MTNEELIAKIEETANIIAGALTQTDDAEAILMAPWLRELTPAQMVALVDRFGGEVTGNEYPRAMLKVAGVSVSVSGLRIEIPNTALDRLRAAARAAAEELNTTTP